MRALLTRAAVSGAVAILLCIAGWAAPAAPAAATAHAADHSSVRTVLPTDLNDFRVDSFDAEYELGRDAEGRSTLRTVERIVAVFPDFDQNRGLIRDLPRAYGDHHTELQVRSVRDEHGTSRPFSTEISGDVLSVIMAVPEGSFVHGSQTYVIEYEQRDVTRAFDDTGVDEFYWDVNGTDWAQPLGRVSARLLLDPALVPALTGAASCYRGVFGASEPCEIVVDEGIASAEVHGLAPYENLTIAVAFAPGTFAAPPVPFLQRVPLLIYGGWAALAAAIATTVLTVVRSLRGARTGRAIIAQYEPPANLSVAAAAELLRKRGKAMTATLLDLAVRRRLRLLHDEASGYYGVQPLNDTGLLPDEQFVWRRLFSPRNRAAVWFDRTSTRLGDAAAALRGRMRSDAVTAGLLRKSPGGWVALICGLFIASLGLFVLHAVLIGDFTLMTVLLAVGINVLVWLLIGLTWALLALRTRTPAGALVHDHLMGLREYIRLAEADRIRMLQSASGAEVGPDLIVRVYERLLPYAVLFGFETEWQSELARYYQESSPEWVGGTAAKSSFSSAIPLAAFSSSVTSSPVTRTSSSGSGSGSSFSSSSGGSSGGGFSGGGGGGGGGRGI